jgi:hypothetical protein
LRSRHDTSPFAFKRYCEQVKQDPFYEHKQSTRKSEILNLQYSSVEVRLAIRLRGAYNIIKHMQRAHLRKFSILRAQERIRPKHMQHAHLRKFSILRAQERIRPFDYLCRRHVHELPVTHKCKTSRATATIRILVVAQEKIRPFVQETRA